MKYIFDIFNRHMQTLREQSYVVEFLRDLLVFIIANKVFHSDGLSFNSIGDCFFLPRLSKS